MTNNAADQRSAATIAHPPTFNPQRGEVFFVVIQDRELE
jgi:hypothetical protein